MEEKSSLTVYESNIIINKTTNFTLVSTSLTRALFITLRKKKCMRSNNNNKTQQSSEMQNQKTHETKTNENEFTMRIRMQNGIVCHLSGEKKRQLRKRRRKKRKTKTGSKTTAHNQSMFDKCINIDFDCTKTKFKKKT